MDFVIAYLRKSPVKQLRLRRTTSTVVVPAGSVPPQVERKARLLVLALVVNTIFVFTRGMFRTVELLDGWDGKLATVSNGQSVAHDADSRHRTNRTRPCSRVCS